MSGGVNYLLHAAHLQLFVCGEISREELKVVFGGDSVVCGGGRAMYHPLTIPGRSLVYTRSRDRHSKTSTPDNRPAAAD